MQRLQELCSDMSGPHGRQIDMGGRSIEFTRYYRSRLAPLQAPTQRRRLFFSGAARVSNDSQRIRDYANRHRYC